MTQRHLLVLPSRPPDSVEGMESSKAEALILAGAGTVWDIITDAGNYPVWDSGITEIRGSAVASSLYTTTWLPKIMSPLPSLRSSSTLRPHLANGG
jgi:hypothetical protein